MSIFDNDKLFEGFRDGSVETESNSEISEDEDTYKQLAEKLRIENEKLKRSLRILAKPNSIKIRDPAVDGPIAHVLLFNNVIARKYKEEILDFFQVLSSRKIDGEDSVVTDPQPTFIQYVTCENHSAPKQTLSKRVQASLKAFQAFSSVQIYKKFFSDQLGEPLSFQDPEISEWFCPYYEKVGSHPLSGDPDNPIPKRKKFDRICFNCGESDHQMKECPRSRDYRAINQRRQKFNEEVAKYSDGSPQIRLGGPRYHADEDEKENKSRFASFKPGVLSSNLQEALGITDEQIPQYIYKMRELGYPPGHLQKAQITNSGLSLYNEYSRKRGKTKDEEYVPVDTDKIIGYPGFNIPPLPGQVDNCREFGAPPMDEKQSKEIMISYFQHRNNLHTQQKATEAKQAEKVEEPKGDVDIEEVDMEFGDEEGEIIEEIAEAVKEMEDGEVDDDGSDQGIVVEVGDLTEDELEIKREMLLKELRQSSASKHDSDYRNVKSSDQDYRIKPQEIIDLTMTLESEQEWSLAASSCSKDTDDRRDKTPVQISLDDKCTHKKESPSHGQRMSSGDMDYRMNGNSLASMPVRRDDEGTHQHKEGEKSAINSEIIPPAGEPPQMIEGCNSPLRHLPASLDQKLPGREKFAEGITQFDAYYAQSKSSGMYNKLRTLLKESPRRQEK